MAKQLIQYMDFSGGLNVDSAPDNLADNELETAQNVNLSDRGGFTKRKGIAALNSTSYGFQIEQVFEWLRKDGTAQLMCVGNDDLYEIDNDGILTKVQDLASNTRKVFWFSFRDSLYFGDGVNYYVYNGTTCSVVSAASGADLTAVKRCTMAIWHAKSNRFMFCGDSQNKLALYYSEPNEPNNVKAVSVLYPTHMMGEITSIREFGDSVLVQYKYGARFWRGIDPTSDVVWEEIPLKQGAMNDGGVSLTPNSLTFPARGGLYAISPTLLSMPASFQASEGIITNLAENKVSSIIRNISNPLYVRGIYDPQNERFMLAYSETSTTRNDTVLVFDWELQAFTIYTGWDVNDWCLRANGDIVFASNEYVYKIGQGYSDNGVPINCVVETKRYNLGFPANRKVNFKAYGHFKPGGNQQSTVDVQISSEDGSVSYSNINLNDSFVWGQNWGGLWGSDKILIKQMKAKLKGNRFQIKFTNNIDEETLTVYGSVFEFKTRKPKGEKVVA